jgi:hypothetical protein
MGVPAESFQAYQPHEIPAVTAVPDESPSTVVVALPAADAGLTPGARVARAAVRGAVVGVVLMAIIGSAISLIAGFGLTPSVAIGFFCAFWGGLGFGGMFGALFGLMREEDTTYPF